MSATRLIGVGVSPGRASGPVVRVAEQLPEPPAAPAPRDPKAEAARIRPAAETVTAQLHQRAASVTGEAKTVLETTAAMASDPALLAKAEKLVLEGAVPAPRAVYQASNGFAETLEAAGGYLAERARDVHDVRDRIVAALLGIEPPGVPNLSGPSVLVAKDLAPADTAGLDPALVLALVTEEGGPTSHTAILARSLSIPAVVACRGVLELDDIAGLVVDGESGVVEVPDGPVEVQVAKRQQAVDWSGEGRTSEGHRVKVLANVGSAEDARVAAGKGAEGIGLFRTEFCFLSVTEEPSVAAQRAAYAQVLAQFQGKPVIVRTLDAGADKPLPFLNTVAEPNPALGVRGVRLGREHLGVFDRQLEAIAAAATDSSAEVAVMAPMIATAEEAAWFAERVYAAGLPRAGVMIEVPAAALLARQIFQAIDFVSVGTNDLAQYTFAADRMLGSLATLNNPWQPALLRLIALIGEAATAAGKPVGVCGEAASDPLLGCVLAGFGVTSLSMAAGSIPLVGAALGGVTLDQCQLAARGVLTAADPAAARAVAKAALG